MTTMKRYSDNPVDQSQEFKDSGMVLITDRRADALLDLAAKKMNEDKEVKE